MSGSQHQRTLFHTFFIAFSHSFAPACSEMESAYISGMCPSGATPKKQHQGVTAPSILPALIHFLCRIKSKYFINRSFITVCCSRGKCTLTYSWNRVLPAHTPWNKQHSTTERMGNSVCSWKDTEVVKLYHIQKFTNNQDDYFLESLSLSL